MALSAATSWPGTRGDARRAGSGPRAALGWRRGALWGPRPPQPRDRLNRGWRAASPYTGPWQRGARRALSRLRPLPPGLPRRGAPVTPGGLGPRALAFWSPVGAHSPPRPAPARPPRPPPRPGRGPRPALPGGGGGGERRGGAAERPRPQSRLRAGRRAGSLAPRGGPRALLEESLTPGERAALRTGTLPSPPSGALWRPDSALGLSPEGPSRGAFRSRGEVSSQT